MNKKHNSNLVPYAQKLRRTMTKEERHLWYDFLCNYPTKFVKQKVVDDYILDFYCHKAKLVIEIDGSQHFTQEGMQNDEFRTEVLQGYDLQVIRFTNHQINTRFREVCEYIDFVVNSCLSQHKG